MGWEVGEIDSTWGWLLTPVCTHTHTQTYTPPKMKRNQPQARISQQVQPGKTRNTWDLWSPCSSGDGCPYVLTGHQTPTFLLRGAGSSNRNGSESVSKPWSVWGDPKASPRYLGLAWGWGGDGVEMPLLPLQCPLVVLLPLSDTSPLSFHGSPQAARETGQRERWKDTQGLIPRNKRGKKEVSKWRKLKQY